MVPNVGWELYGALVVSFAPVPYNIIIYALRTWDCGPGCGQHTAMRSMGLMDCDKRRL